MLDTPTPFPQVGSTGYLSGTAEPARILQHCGNGTFLVERRKRTPGGGTAPLEGASANRRIDAGEIHASVDAAMFGSQQAARQARRAQAAGGSPQAIIRAAGGW